MKTLLSSCSLSLMFLLVMTSAHGGERSERDQQREARSEQRQQERGAPQERAGEAQQAAPPEEKLQAHPEPGKKSGRMSPEERRALRRQIDEAGHDIYTKGKQ